MVPSCPTGRGPTRAPLPVGHDGTIQGDERGWNGRTQIPVLCQAGDCLLFRSEVWHRGSQNRTLDRCRYMLQVHYGQRGMAQRFPPHLEFRHNPETLAAATPRQLRLLGKHEIRAYG
jgi:ectoine hydroxylase-related dioxygenase (phytanoyl-CoA dioxygenase family)